MEKIEIFETTDPSIGLAEWLPYHAEFTGRCKKSSRGEKKVEVVVDREKRYGFLWLRSKRIKSVEWIKPENIRTWKITDCKDKENE